MTSDDARHTETSSLIGREVTALVDGHVADISIFVQPRRPAAGLPEASEAPDKLVVGLRIDYRRAKLKPVLVLVESGASRQLAAALASASDVSEDLPFRFVARL